MSSGEGKSDPAKFEHAKIMPVTDNKGRKLNDKDKKAKAVTVQFNPETLDITLSNNFRKSSGRSPVQLVDEATAQLSLELQFDTTLTGVDVRQDTGKIATFLRPLDTLVKAGRRKKLPPPAVVEFDWGAISFQGYIDSYSETLDYFSSEGVPLRAKVSLSLTQQERSFDPQERDAGRDENGRPKTEAFSTDSVKADPFAEGAAVEAVDPNAPMDTGTAAANKIENPRQPGVGAVSKPTEGGFGRPPAAFAKASIGGGVSVGGGISAGAGLSAGASAGIGLSAGIGGATGISAGFSASVGAGAPGGVSLSTSNSASNTATAFVGLSAKPPKLELTPIEIEAGKPAKTTSTGAIGLGGAVKSETGASLSTNVGSKITFGTE